MKDKTQGEMIRARRAVFVQMTIQGIVQVYQILDNNIYEAHKQEIKDTTMTYHLDPPDDHHCNIAEREIQIQKNHLNNILSSTTVFPPLHL